MKSPQKIPAALQSHIDAGRAFLSTNQAAIAIGFAPQTLRSWACFDKAPHGIRPIKISNRLRWSIEDLVLLFHGSV